MAKMRNSEVLALLGQQLENSIGYFEGNIGSERRTAFKYYLGKPYGNEIEGRSQVVTQDVLEVVENILPSLLRIFTAGEQIVKFDPQGPEDQEVAEQCTDYINHIFMKDNPGFMILYTMFKDALLQKNGFVKHYYKEITKENKEEYVGLTDTEFTSLLMDDDTEILEDIERTVEAERGTEVVHDVKIVKTKREGRVCVENIAPEEMFVSKNAKSFYDAQFVGHRVIKTRAEVIEMGFDKKLVDKLPSYTDGFYNQEHTERELYQTESPETEYQSIDRSTDYVRIVECYTKIDYEKTGKPTLRKITIGGNESIILDNEEIDYLPFSMITPIPMPHLFYGMSVADLVMDLQLMKSTVLRQTMDNMYLQNNARHLVIDGQVQLDDLISSRPGGIVRTKGPGAVTPLATPSFLNEGLAMLEKIDQLKEARTGISRSQMGADPNTIQKSHTTATSVNALVNASTQRIELIARIFAETGVKDLFKCIMQLVTKYQDKGRIIRLRNNFVEMKPMDWADKEMDVSIQVGLGTGNTDQRVNLLSQILQIQQMLVKEGGYGRLVDENKIYNTLEKLVINAGFNSAQPFFVDPATVPPPPPPDPMKENPLLMAAMAEIEAGKQKAVADIQQKREEMVYDMQKKILELETKLKIEAEKNDSAELRKAADLENTAMQNMYRGQNLNGAK
tara:strand:- start:1484 stop:3511 length:2028 start_codon:yes stop_codon:yes gene_type:complete